MKTTKIMKRILMTAVAVCVTASVVGCSPKSTPTTQFEAPVKGQQIATVSIKDFGEVKIMFFEKSAPKAVENFVTHAKNGYYDGLTFHRVMDGFMIQGGDPNGNGTGGESIWGEPFEDEFDKNLCNYTGALSMANSGVNTNGSQFFIMKGQPGISADQLAQMSKRGYSKEQIEKYEELGGAPWLDDVHTVFGQVYEGIEIVQDVMNSGTDANDAPLEPVVIESIVISTVE